MGSESKGQYRKRKNSADVENKFDIGPPPVRGQAPDYGGPSERGIAIVASANRKMRNIGHHLIHYINKTGRRCVNKEFGVDTFYNALVLGVFDLHIMGDLKPEEIAEKGLLETIIDRGTYIYAKKMTPELFEYADDQESKRKGRKKTAEPPDVEGEARPAEKQAWTSLVIPQDFLLSGNRRRNVVRAEEK